MNIFLSPIRMDKEIYTLEKRGDALYLNGAEVLESNEWFISRNGEDITLLFPHGLDASEKARFPEPLMGVPDGIIQLPK